MTAVDPDFLRRAVARAIDSSSDYDLNPQTVLAADRVLRPAGVLVAVCETRSGPAVLLTRRSSRLKHHPGQIAFPGGKVDPADEGPVAAALREAWEEVGLPTAAVTVIGTLPVHETVTGYLVTPVLAMVAGAVDPVPEPGEVDEVFTVPLRHLLDPAKYRVERRRWRGEWRRYYAVPYGPHYIWGATARILRGLADRLHP